MGTYSTAAWTAREQPGFRAGRLWRPAKVSATGGGTPYGLLRLSLRIPKGRCLIETGQGLALHAHGSNDP